MASQTLFNDQELQDVLDKDLLELLGAKNMPDEQKQELYLKMAHTVENRVIARIDDKLDDTSREEFVKLIDAGDKAKVEDFLRSKGMDIAKMMVEEALMYKMEITSLAKQSQKQE